MGRLINVLIVMLTLLYPATVYYGMQYFQPREIALMLAVLLLLRLMVIQSRITLQIGLIGLVYAGFAAYSNQLIALRFYPVVVNTGMLLIFASSLIYPPCVIERLARLQNPVLPPQAPPYLFRLTQIWCGFFVINGSIALFTALYSSFEIWSLYNGLIAYLLMGLLFAGEYCVRQRIQKSGMWL